MPRFGHSTPQELHRTKVSIMCRTRLEPPLTPPDVHQELTLYLAFFNFALDILRAFAVDLAPDAKRRAQNLFDDSLQILRE